MIKVKQKQKEAIRTKRTRINQKSGSLKQSTKQTNYWSTEFLKTEVGSKVNRSPKT